MVSHAHIDALLTFADLKRMKDRLAWAISRVDQLDWTDIGRVLLAENERSVCERYHDCVPGNLPGTLGEEAITYRFRTFSKFLRMSATDRCIWAIKACDCFDYQACETDDYADSIAAKIVREIRSEAVRTLPGYDAAPWGIDHEHAKA